jgi:hypothetical protein
LPTLQTLLVVSRIIKIGESTLLQSEKALFIGVVLLTTMVGLYVVLMSLVNMLP